VENSTVAIFTACAGVLGGMSGGLLSGIYQEWRDKREQPILEIDYLGNNANRTERGNEIYIRASVRNKSI
jgi:hypothetical protein